MMIAARTMAEFGHFEVLGAMLSEMCTWPRTHWPASDQEMMPYPVFRYDPRCAWRAIRWCARSVSEGWCIVRVSGEQSGEVGIMAEMDQGIKRLIQTHPQDILAFAVPEAEYLGTLPVDVATERQLVLDSLLRVRIEGIECAVDVEAGASPQKDMAKRLYEYGSRVQTTMDLPVISVVFWLQRNGKRPASPYRVQVGRRRIVDWYFTGIALYDIPAQTLLDRGITGLLPLVPFCRDGDKLEVIEQAAELVKTQTTDAEQRELESLLAIFGARFVGNEPILAMIGRLFMSTEILETSPLYQLWVSEATEKGMAQGMAQGLREAVLAVLGSRFGELAPDLVAAINSATVEQLRDLLAHVGTESLEHITRRLGEWS